MLATIMSHLNLVLFTASIESEREGGRLGQAAVYFCNF